MKATKRERQRHKQRVMNAIDFAVLKKPNQSLADLIKAVQKEKIQVVLRQNDNGIIYGITYVDHHTKCIFNGSHLGKQYSANGIQQRCNAAQLVSQTSNAFKQSFSEEKSGQVLEHEKLKPVQSNNKENFDVLQFAKSASKLFDDLLQPEENRNANEPLEQKKFKRKRKRKQQHSHN